MKKYNVGILGATGMVGQRFITLLAEHPWFNITILAASKSSAGKTYSEALNGRWAMSNNIPEKVKNMPVYDAVGDMKKIVDSVDFVFCAVNMKKDEIRALEEMYAKAECPVISNNSAHRTTPDVPMIIPEVNPEHMEIIFSQRKRLGTKKGFIAVKSNCSLQCYVPAIHPLLDFGVTNVLACTYQAISGAGKTFERWPEMVDNIIPYISGEEEKSESEPMKIWGKISQSEIKNAVAPNITTQCIRVPVSDGHSAAVFASFKNPPSLDEIISRWQTYKGLPDGPNLPSAPKQFLHYFDYPSLPQIRSARELENGMAISIGRLRADSQYDVKFVCMSHNTIRGAAGGAVLMAELLCAKGFFD
ncbi:MAG: aspartate-semialdehyde dehydrogenase [Bacilli bacterium]